MLRKLLLLATAAGLAFVPPQPAFADLTEGQRTQIAQLRKTQQDAMKADREKNRAQFEDLRAALSSGEQVKLSGFGNFDLRDKNQRPGRNPKTGEEIPITARRVVTFRPGQKLKARVEAYAGTRE